MKMFQLKFRVTIITLFIVSELFSQSIGTKVQITTSSNQKAECSIAIDPTNSNNILAGTMTLTGDNITKVGTFYSTNGGTTWSGNDILLSEYDVDPSVAYDADGNAYICYLYNVVAGTNKIYLQKSTNKGQTWQTRVEVPALYDADKTFIAIDKNINSPYKNNIYVVWNKNESPIVFSKSTNGGTNFSNEINVTSTSQPVLGAAPAVGNNGEIYVAYSIGNPNCTGIGFVKSTDGGATFSSQQQIASVNQIGVLDGNRYKLKSNRIRVNSHPSVSVDPVNGYIYVVYATKSINGDADVMLVKSTNNGISWSTPLKINNDNTNTDQWFPWVDISPSGEINVVFYDSRVDPVNNDLSEVYIARSIDGGSTFSNFNVSNSPFQPQALPNSPSGYFMGDYIGITSANQKAFPVWTDNTSGTFQLYTSKVDFNQSVTVDQKRESGTSLTGTTVAKWEGSSFVNYQVPATFNFSVGSSVVLRGLQDIVQSPSEKFNKWNVDENVINHRAVTIVPGTNQIVSQFRTTQAGTTIKNQLLESSLTGNGTIDFADPWLIDFNESPYGLRNQGSTAPMKSRTSPFYPDYSTYYGSDIYKGIFLDQLFSSGVYYSVQSQATQSINGYTSYFQNWSATNATPQDASALTTGVVFTNNNAVVTANYKGHLISNATTGFSSNTQRKVVRTDNDQFHMVYESMNQVWYTRSTDGGSTWLEEQKVDYLGANCKSASIAQSNDGLNKVYVVYQRDAVAADNYPKIILTEFQNGSRTLYEDVYNLSSYSYDTKPVTAALNNTVCVVFKPSSTSALSEKNFYYSGSWSAHSDFQVNNTTSNSSNPSIASDVQKYFLAYQNGTTEIKYLEFFRGVNDILSTYEESIITTGSPYTNNIDPSISSHEGDPLISWSGYSGSIPTAIVKRRVSGTWSNFNSFASGSVRSTNNSSRDTGTDGSIIAWGNIYYEHKFVKLLNGVYSSITNIPETAGNGQIQLSNGYDFNNIKSVVLKQPLSGIYEVKPLPFNFLTLQKASGNALSNYGRMAIVQKEKKNFVYYLGGIKVDGENIKFQPFADTSKIKDSKMISEVISTEYFHLTSKSALVFGNLYYAFENDKYKELKDNDATFSIELVNLNGKTVTGEFNASKYEFSKITDDESIYKLDCSKIEEGTYYLRVKCNVDGVASYYINDMQSEDTPELNKKTFEEIKIMGVVIPNDYQLGNNYPNPFNPSTVISYSIPLQEYITLKVYDVLGKEVATLVDGIKSAGNYNATFDASKLSSGVYLYILKAGKFTQANKMLLMK